MNDKKKNRRNLRNRLQRAQQVILKRLGYSPGLAKRMARIATDKTCAEVKE